MPDYTYPVNATTTLMIRDTGISVEFWIKTAFDIWNNAQPWSFRANGKDSGTLIQKLLRGGFWHKLGETSVEFDQEVSYTIYDSGVGFPTATFTQYITRGAVPPAPILRSTSAISPTYIRVVYQLVDTSGPSILEGQVGYGLNPNGPTGSISSNGTVDVGPFLHGQRVYFWARVRNITGWSLWSNRMETLSWRVPYAPYPAKLLDISQTSLKVELNLGPDGGSPILQRQMGYSLDLYGTPPNEPFNISTITEDINIISGLEAGRSYWIWSRSRNSVGWGLWSEPRRFSLQAGIRIRIEGEWKRAVPYVRSGGVWKLAKPLIKDQGAWKEPN